MKINMELSCTEYQELQDDVRRMLNTEHLNTQAYEQILIVVNSMMHVCQQLAEMTRVDKYAKDEIVHMAFTILQEARNTKDLAASILKALDPKGVEEIERSNQD